MKKLIMAVLLMTFVQVSYGEITVYGAGIFSCGKWIEDREKQDIWPKLASTSWVAGYVTAAQDRGYITLKKTDVHAMAAYVDKYCRENPLNDVTDASRALVDALRQ